MSEGRRGSATAPVSPEPRAPSPFTRPGYYDAMWIEGCAPGGDAAVRMESQDDSVLHDRRDLTVAAQRAGRVARLVVSARDAELHVDWKASTDGSDVQVLMPGGVVMMAAHSGYEDAEAAKTACREGYVVRDPSSNPGSVGVRLTQLGLRDQLAGHILLNWGPGTPLAQWVGVQLSGEPARVTGLNFRFRHPDHYLGGCLDPAFAARLAEVSNVKVCAAESEP